MKSYKNQYTIYDFDEFNLFVMNLILNLPNYTNMRYSASGFGIHIETNLELEKFQDQNREFWSSKYGYNITWLTKHGNHVGIWLEKKNFIRLYFNDILRKCIFKQNKYSKG